MQTKPTWEQLVAQAQDALAALTKPAAPSEQAHVFVDIDDLDPSLLGYTATNADDLCLESEAEDIYLGYRPMPSGMEWAAGLNMDEFVDAYMQCA